MGGGQAAGPGAWGGEVCPGGRPALASLFGFPTLREALRRELREELALREVTVGQALYRHEAPGLTLAFFAMTTEEQPQSLEHPALAWIDPTQPTSLPMAPSDEACLERLRG